MQHTCIPTVNMQPQKSDTANCTNLPTEFGVVPSTWSDRTQIHLVSEFKIAVVLFIYFSFFTFSVLKGYCKLQPQRLWHMCGVWGTCRKHSRSPVLLWHYFGILRGCNVLTSGGVEGRKILCHKTHRVTVYLLRSW